MAQINPQYTYDYAGNPVGVFLSIKEWMDEIKEKNACFNVGIYLLHFIFLLISTVPTNPTPEHSTIAFLHNNK